MRKTQALKMFLVSFMLIFTYVLLESNVIYALAFSAFSFVAVLFFERR